MDWIHQFDLFLFDFDGLLVNSEELHFKAYREMCRRRGYDLPWNIHQFFEAAHLSSTGIRTGLQALFPKMFEEEPNWDVLYAEKKKIYEESLAQGNLSLMPGVEPLLIELAKREKKRCVVTNSARVQIEAIQQQLPLLKTIPRWFTRETYEKPKPAPDGYLVALRELKEEGDRVIGFEDSLRGLQSLKDAGVETAVLICEENHPQLALWKDEKKLYASTFDDVSNLL